MVEKGFDLGGAEGLRMALAMKEDELPNPESVGRLGAWAEVAPTAGDGDKVKQAWFG